MSNPFDLKFIDGMNRKEFKKMVWLIITTFDIGKELGHKDQIQDYMHDLKGIVCEDYENGFSPRYEGQKIVDMSKRYHIMPQTLDAVDILLERTLKIPQHAKIARSTTVDILDLLCFMSKHGDLRDKFVQFCQGLLDEVVVTPKDAEHITNKEMLLSL